MQCKAKIETIQQGVAILMAPIVVSKTETTEEFLIPPIEPMYTVVNIPAPQPTHTVPIQHLKTIDMQDRQVVAQATTVTAIIQNPTNTPHHHNHKEPTKARITTTVVAVIAMAATNTMPPTTAVTSHCNNSAL